MRKTIVCIVLLLAGLSLTACQQKDSASTANELETGMSAIEDAMQQKPAEKSEENSEEGDDVREGTSVDTVATPDDFPEAYAYGSGKISDYSRNMMLKKMPEPAENQTVLNAAFRMLWNSRKKGIMRLH